MRLHGLLTAASLALALTLGACSHGGSTADSTAVPVGTAATDTTTACSRFVAAIALASTASTHIQGAASLAGSGTTTGPVGAAERVLTATQQTLLKTCRGHLADLVQANLQGMRAQRPYAYIVPFGHDAATAASYARQLRQVGAALQRGITPGNLLAFAGPSSTRAAGFVKAAFKPVSPGSLKGIIVVFVGDGAQQQSVANVVRKSGATFRFAQM